MSQGTFVRSFAHEGRGRGGGQAEKERREAPLPHIDPSRQERDRHVRQCTYCTDRRRRGMRDDLMNVPSPSSSLWLPREQDVRQEKGRTSLPGPKVCEQRRRRRLTRSPTGFFLFQPRFFNDDLRRRIKKGTFFIPRCVQASPSSSFRRPSPSPSSSSSQND